MHIGGRELDYDLEPPCSGAEMDPPESASTMAGTVLANVGGSIDVLCLGAGQDVGRSCVVVKIGQNRIMFDCGMHMGFRDERKFPAFSLLCPPTSLSTYIDCVVITHFHMDHCGALPYLTEVCGYRGPIIMTAPTRAICPLLLEDYVAMVEDRLGESGLPFTTAQISTCMERVTTIGVREHLQLTPTLSIKSFYAGHVLGAVMFEARCGMASVVYTGDYNMAADRHLGAASIDRVMPDLLITESTYATRHRTSRGKREQNFLQEIQKCVADGGKVLIPVFALGRAQELCILLDSFWEQQGLHRTVPIFFGGALMERANDYYKLFLHWTNQDIKANHAHHNMFEFKHIKPFDERLLERAPNQPFVLFSSPGMLHGGASLDRFKTLAPDPRNLVVIPGYCVKGTIGHRLVAGERGLIHLDRRTTVNVRCKVVTASFSAHADSRGILQLIRQVQPRNVMLVHGDSRRMEAFKRHITSKCGLPSFSPPNGETLRIPLRKLLACHVSPKFKIAPQPSRLQASAAPTVPIATAASASKAKEGPENVSLCAESGQSLSRLASRPFIVPKPPGSPSTHATVEGFMVQTDDPQTALLVSPSDAAKSIGLVEHRVHVCLAPADEVLSPSSESASKRQRLQTEHNAPG